jgi:hypothetical protein
MQIQQGESRPYYNFINSIRSDSSKVSYGGELRRYLRHYNILSVDKLLELPDKETKIIDYILQQKGVLCNVSFFRDAYLSLKWQHRIV